MQAAQRALASCAKSHYKYLVTPAINEFSLNIYEKVIWVLVGHMPRPAQNKPDKKCEVTLGSF